MMLWPVAMHFVVLRGKKIKIIKAWDLCFHDMHVKPLAPYNNIRSFANMPILLMEEFESWKWSCGH